MKLILASASKARQQMLSNGGFTFEVKPADIDEETIKQTHLESDSEPHKLPMKLAHIKACSVSGCHQTDIVIGSDQILICNGQVFSKVKNLKAAAMQLQAMQGRDHELISAVAVYQNGVCLFEHSETAVLRMHHMSEKEIGKYLAFVGSKILGSVGCYHIEAEGVQLFENIQGSHFTIMGMPLIPLLGFLRKSVRDLT